METKEGEGGNEKRSRGDYRRLGKQECKRRVHKKFEGKRLMIERRKVGGLEKEWTGMWSKKDWSREGRDEYRRAKFALKRGIRQHKIKVNE